MITDPSHPRYQVKRLRSPLWLGATTAIALFIGPFATTSAYGDAPQTSKLTATIKQLSGTYKTSSDIPGNPITSIELRGADVKEPTMRQIGGLSQLRELCLAKTKLTGGSLQHLSRCEQLRELDLEKAPIKGENLRYLKPFRKLKTLRLASPHIADDHLRDLAHLVKLQTLALRCPLLTDNSIDHLVVLRALKKLDLRGSQITEDGESRLREKLPGVLIQR